MVRGYGFRPPRGGHRRRQARRDVPEEKGGPATLGGKGDRAPVRESQFCRGTSSASVMRPTSSAAVGSGSLSAASRTVAAFGGALAGALAVGGAQIFVCAVERVSVDAGAVDDPAGAVVGQPQVHGDGLLDEVVARRVDLVVVDARFRRGGSVRA